MRLNLFGATVLCALMAHQLVQAEELKLPEKQTNWRSCSDELKSPHISDEIEVYSHQCPAVNGTDSKCYLKKGEPVTLIIRFKPKETVTDLERIIIARVPAALDKKIEVPYGPPMNPCVNVTSTDGTGCVNDGVEAGKWYTYASSFDVLQSFPAVQNLETRHILRQRNDKHKKLRLYKKHPGPNVYCILVPNIYVVE